MFFQPALSFALVPLGSGMVPLWLPRGSGAGGGQFLGFCEQIKDLGREQGWGVGCRASVPLAGQDAHGMGSATLASLHPLVLPWHLCNELIQVRNGDGSCTGRELSPSGCWTMLRWHWGSDDGMDGSMLRA